MHVVLYTVQHGEFYSKLENKDTILRVDVVSVLAY